MSNEAAFLDYSVLLVLSAGGVYTAAQSGDVLLGLSVLCVLALVLTLRTLRGHYRKSVGLLLVSWVFVIELCLTPFVTLMSESWTLGFLQGTSNPIGVYSLALFCSALFGVCLLVAYVSVSAVLARRGTATQTTRTITRSLKLWEHSLWILAAGSASLALLSVTDTLVTAGDELFSNRRIGRQGKGPLISLLFFGYWLVVLRGCRIAEQVCGQEPSTAGVRWTDLLAILIAGAPFALMGRRGEALYPVLLFLLARSIASGGGGIKFLKVPAIGAVVLFIIEKTSAMLRASVTESTHAIEYFAPSRVFSHVELLASLQLNDTRFSVGSVFAGLTNWIPRSFWPDKPLSTGGLLAGQLMPEWVQGGLLASAITTGPIVESWLYGGWAGLAIGGCILGALLAWCDTKIRHAAMGGSVASIRGLMIGLVGAYMLGWRVWFNDLGGIVNDVLGLTFTFIVSLTLFRLIRAKQIRT